MTGTPTREERAWAGAAAHAAPGRAAAAGATAAARAIARAAAATERAAVLRRQADADERAWGAGRGPCPSAATQRAEARDIERDI